MAMKFGVSFSVSSCLIAAAALLAQVSAQEQETVAVVERISVPSDLTPADNRIDLGNEEFIGDDQLAEKSQLTQQIFAQERDGGGHGHHGQHAQGKQHSTCSATYLRPLLLLHLLLLLLEQDAPLDPCGSGELQSPPGCPPSAERPHPSASAPPRQAWLHRDPWWPPVQAVVPAPAPAPATAAAAAAEEPVAVKGDQRSTK